MRYTEIRSPRRGSLETCNHGNRPLHHENPSTVESCLLDDIIEAQTKSWEHLWIDIGGEG